MGNKATKFTVRVPYDNHTIKEPQNPILIIKAPTLYKVEQVSGWCYQGLGV